jgi:hypothetical protein
MTLTEVKQFDNESRRLKLNLELCDNELKEAKKFNDHARLIKAYKAEADAHRLLDVHYQRLVIATSSKS